MSISGPTKRTYVLKIFFKKVLKDTEFKRL